MIDIDKELMAYFRELSPTERRDMLKKMTDEGSLDAEAQEEQADVHDELDARVVAGRLDGPSVE